MSSEKSRQLFLEIFEAILRAEKMYGHGSGEFKLKYVLENLKEADEDVVKTITEGLLALQVVQNAIKKTYKICCF